MLDVVVDANGGGAGGAWAGAGTGVGAGADAVVCPGVAGFWQATPIIACCMALTCCSAIARCGFWRAPPPRRFVVAGVDGSDAYRAEAEPFTAKRSGTG